VPTARLIERVEREPAIPLEWGPMKPGCRRATYLRVEAAEAWRRERGSEARDDAVAHARELLDLKVHKRS